MRHYDSLEEALNDASLLEDEDFSFAYTVRYGMDNPRYETYTKVTSIKQYNHFKETTGKAIYKFENDLAIKLLYGDKLDEY